MANEQVPVGDTFFDYENQAWVIGGVYQRCGHPETMDCGCFGKLHAGQRAPWQAVERAETEHGSVVTGRASLKAAINHAVRGYGEGRNMSYRESMIDAGRGHLLRGNE